MLKLMPAPELAAVMREAYLPCMYFATCPEAVWAPAAGHAPRGFLGATGRKDDVWLVMVFAEPGGLYPGHSHGSGTDPDETMLSCLQQTYNCIADGRDQFHRNVRTFLDLVFPRMPFEEQLRRTWLTEGRLCSFAQETGGRKDHTCARHYLARQIAVLPNAVIVAFGGKAQDYMKRLRIPHLAAFSLAPPGANRPEARQSWLDAAGRVRQAAGLETALHHMESPPMSEEDLADLPPAVARAFATLSENGRYQPKRLKGQQTQLLRNGKPIGGWNRKDHHFYLFETTRARGFPHLDPTRFGFRRIIQPLRNGKRVYWRLDGAGGAGHFLAAMGRIDAGPDQL